MNLDGNTVLVTGGTSGIGRELAAQLLRRGNTVLVTGRDPAALDATRQSLPGVRTFHADVRDPRAIAALHDRVVEEFPRLNILINNAGIMRKINFHTIGADLEQLTEEVNTNLSGTIRMVARFLPHLKTRDRAAIINVSSGLAFNPYPISPIYSASKAGVHSFTQSLRVQLKRTRVQVFELAPPAVDTPLNLPFAEDLSGTPMISTPQLVTQALRGLEKDHLEIRIGFANVAKLLSRIAPGLILRVLSKPVDRMLDQARQLPP